MYVSYHKITVFVGLPNGFQKLIPVPAPQYAGRILRSFFGVRRIKPLNLGSRHKGDFNIPHNKVDRLSRLRNVSARSHIGNARLPQGIKCIRQRLRPVVVGVIIGQRYKIHSQISQIGNGLRPCPKGKLFPFCRNASVRIGKFIVKHHDIRALHPFHHFRQHTLRYIAVFTDRPGNGIMIVKQDVARKGKRHLAGNRRFHGIDIIFFHIGGVRQLFLIFGRLFHLFPLALRSL